MKNLIKTPFGIAGVSVFSLMICSSCSESPEEETAAPKPTIAAPKKIVKENDDLNVVPASENDRSQRGGRGDWDNMSEEEKEKRREEWQKRREEWENMSEEERNEAREERRREFMAEVDKNGDGILGKDELPERMWEFMSRADKDGDNQITEAERTEFRAEMEAERALRELNGEEPRGFGRPPGGKGFGGKGFGGKGGGGNRDN